VIISRTPFRLSLLGGGTDYPQWFLKNGGEVLAGAIDKYCYLTLRWLPPFFEHRHRIVYSQVENTMTSIEIQHPAVRAAINRLDLDDGIELHHDGDLPARSGIGSSAAFAVGLLHAGHRLKGEHIDPWALAHEAIDLEVNDLQETTGLQDQLTCALGGFHHLKFEKTGSIASERSQRMSRALPELNEWLVLLYSGVQRSSHQVSQTLVESFQSKDELLNELQSLVGVGRDCVERGDVDGMVELGRLMHRSWEIKDQLNPAAVSPRLRLLYDAAREAGAVGGKVSGAGGGGFMVFVVPPERRSSFIQNMRGQALHVPFKFVDHGSQIIYEG
jgi:D-glycero-alpha-D-manno-heptose-7-phosphate kinase